MTRPVPAAGESLPLGLVPDVDCCADCGDTIAWCPVWGRRWPELQNSRDGRDLKREAFDALRELTADMNLED